MTNSKKKIRKIQRIIEDAKLSYNKFVTTCSDAKSFVSLRGKFCFFQGFFYKKL